MGLRALYRGFKTWLGRQGERASRYEALLKVMFVCVAAIWILVEYYSKQEDGRIAQTMEYAKRVSSGELLSSEHKLTQFWADPATLTRLQALPEGNKKKFDEFIVDVVEKSLKADVWRLFIFYNSLATCVSAQICEPISACNLFKGDLRVFILNYGPYFEHHSKEYKYKALAPIQTLVTQAACVSAEPYHRGWTGWFKRSSS